MIHESPNFLAQLTGCFAKPVAENPTVAMVEAAYHHHGLNWRYINCEVPPELLGDAVRGAKAMGWAGFNCSIPNKIAVIQYLDELGESAQIIGAVNTVVRRDDRYIGENTDGRGFVMALRNIVDPTGKTVVLFGAGGAARAVAVETALAGAARAVLAAAPVVAARRPPVGRPLGHSEHPQAARPAGQQAPQQVGMPRVIAVRQQGVPGELVLSTSVQILINQWSDGDADNFISRL